MPIPSQSQTVVQILAQAQIERDMVNACGDHNFFQQFDTDGKLFQKYECLRCGVVISSAEHNWYTIGYKQGTTSAS